MMNEWMENDRVFDRKSDDPGAREGHESACRCCSQFENPKNPVVATIQSCLHDVMVAMRTTVSGSSCKCTIANRHEGMKGKSGFFVSIRQDVGAANQETH
jgi:hypothetical protein